MAAVSNSVTVYIPNLTKITEAKEDGDFDKFGGLPSVEPGFKYPMCKNCEQPLQFFFQLTSPITGVTIQMFHCIDKDCDVGSKDKWSVYLRCINYTVARTSNLDIKVRESIIKTAYSNTDVTDIYHDKWLNGLYAAGTSYQCYRVASWMPKIELYKPDEKSPYDIDAEMRYDEASLPGLKWGGSGNSALNIDSREYMLHFGDTYYLPYMWGNSGFCHIDESLKMAYDT